MDNREIDAAIAKKIMGWKVKSIQTSSRSWADAWVNDDEKIMAWYREWKPTSDISAAWQVVKKLNMPFTITKIADFYYAKFFDEHGENEKRSGYKENPAEAICLAALQAVGVEGA